MFRLLCTILSLLIACPLFARHATCDAPRPTAVVSAEEQGNTAKEKTSENEKSGGTADRQGRLLHQAETDHAEGGRKAKFAENPHNGIGASSTGKQILSETPDSQTRPSADTIALLHKDTLSTHVTERNQRLYDSLEVKSHRRAVPRLIYKLLFINPHGHTAEDGSVVDENALLEPFAGKTIRTITIDQENVYADPKTWVQRTSNRLHVMTREKIIRRDLLFETGDKFDPELVVHTQQLLRSRPYIYSTEIQILADSLNPDKVDIVLKTRDSWTISVDVNLKSEKRVEAGIYDGNIFGSGNKLKFKTSFRRDNFDYGGNSASYEMPNILGSFFSSTIEGGRCFFEEHFHTNIRKNFLKPTDYEFGASFTNIRSKYYIIEHDSMDLAKARNLDLWAGYSHFFPRIRSSAYLTARYNSRRFGERPLVAPKFNPLFHDHDDLLFGLGLYRERFLTTSMIYGFGFKEYLATGFKAEVVGGYSWSEFDNAYYLGVNYHRGTFRPWGYIMGGFALGSWIDDESGSWERSSFDIDFIWFSNLLSFRRNRIRQFVKLNYTQGWNREYGNNEQIGFTRYNGIRVFNEHAIGTNRLAVNTETVMFTPFQPLGFRFAFFGFADFGTLGRSANVFKNPFFSSFGVGLRIKNERLIFSEVQIQLGVAVGKGGWLGSDWLRVSNGARLEQFRYRPVRPRTMDFQ